MGTARSSVGERHEGDGEKVRYGLLGEWILRLLAVAIVTIVIWLARRAGASWPFAAAYGAIVAVGISLASRGAPTAEKLADAGRALVISILLALVASSIAHSDAKRTSQTALALTLSSGHSFAGIDLHDRDLARFFIGGKNLTDAILSGADLHGAVLRHSTLANADLHGSHTNLTNADSVSRISAELTSARFGLSVRTSSRLTSAVHALPAPTSATRSCPGLTLEGLISATPTSVERSCLGPI